MAGLGEALWMLAGYWRTRLPSSGTESSEGCIVFWKVHPSQGKCGTQWRSAVVIDIVSAACMHGVVRWPEACPGVLSHPYGGGGLIAIGELNRSAWCEVGIG